MARSKHVQQYTLRIPPEAYRHYLLKSRAEAQPMSGLLRSAIMRDYNARKDTEDIVDIYEGKAGNERQLAIPLQVYGFYKRMAEKAGVDLSVILRSVVVADYRAETGWTAEDGKAGEGAGPGKMRGLIEASEEPPLKRGRKKRQDKNKE